MKCVVKRKGHAEKFSDKKLYRSCYYACKSAHLTAKECATISKETTVAVKKSIGGKKCITAHALHIAVCRLLKKRNADAAFMYDTHKDIS